MIIPKDLLEAFAEIVNIGTGKAANSLNEMIGKKIRLEIPVIEIKKSADIINLHSKNRNEMVAIKIDFDGELDGKAILLFLPENAKKLISELIGEPESTDLDFVSEGTLSEIGNIVINNIIGSISNILGVKLGFHVPDFLSGNMEKIIDTHNTNIDVLVAKTSIGIEGNSQVKADIIILFEVKSLENLIHSLSKLVA